MALERREIVDAALSILDEVGIDSLTTRKLAERLGVQQPALYWHFRNKRALLDAMNDEMLRRHHLHVTPASGEDWRTFLEGYAGGFRAALRSHRDGARVHAGSPPVDEAGQQTEAILAFLVSAGFPAVLAMQTVLALHNYVLGAVIDEQADAESGKGWDREAGAPDIATDGLFGTTLTALRQGGRDAAFDAGLSLLLDGFAHRHPSAR